MREIKFRAWDDKKKKWLLGYERPLLGGFHIAGETVMMGEWSRVLEDALHDHIDLKVMQYTGLKDKNGKEIYEGDIVQAIAEEQYKDRHKISDVIFDSDGGWVVRTREHGRAFDHGLAIEWGGWLEIEVIGNIYENPELLEDKQ